MINEKRLTFVELLGQLAASFELQKDLRVDRRIRWGILASWQIISAQDDRLYGEENERLIIVVDDCYDCGCDHSSIIAFVHNFRT